MPSAIIIAKVDVQNLMKKVVTHFNLLQLVIVRLLWFEATVESRVFLAEQRMALVQRLGIECPAIISSGLHRFHVTSNVSDMTSNNRTRTSSKITLFRQQKYIHLIAVRARLLNIQDNHQMWLENKTTDPMKCYSHQPKSLSKADELKLK